ncbi:MAG: hypothetical protein EA402_02925 [Planctomycetota bacterium]|nr:MAG: hypothetical protein EA402_02925 [Planctomycetota bacterium]
MDTFSAKSALFRAFLLSDLEIGDQWREAKGSPGAPISRSALESSTRAAGFPWFLALASRHWIGDPGGQALSRPAIRPRR